MSVRRGDSLERGTTMAIRWDLKSLGIGLLVGMALMLALGAATDSPRYTTAVACNDVWIVFTRIDTHTGEIVARREAVARLAPTLRVTMPTGNQPDASSKRLP